MPPAKRKPTIATIGSGVLGQSLAVALHSAGYRIVEIVSRELPASRRRARALAQMVRATASTIENARLDADILWLCVTDDVIAPLARQLARRRQLEGKAVFHSSGALSSRELAPLARAGAATASVHPMMTFVAGAATRMQGIVFALEGDAAALRTARTIVQDLGGRPFKLAAKSKPLYHATGSFSSPVVIATLANAEAVAAAAGIPRRLVPAIIKPILEQTLSNYKKGGASAAFSGPVRRGDLATIRKHLRELRRVPAALAAYRAFLQTALAFLPVNRRAEISRLASTKRPGARRAC